MIEILEARPEQLPTVRALFLEYAESLDFSLEFQGFAEEVATLPGEFASPSGTILLAFNGSTPVGCVALRPLAGGIAEMKRLYVRPNHVNQGIGRALVNRAIQTALSAGYQKIRLDTVPDMHAAIRLYQSIGFRQIMPYRENPVAGTMFLELKLPLGPV